MVPAKRRANIAGERPGGEAPPRSAVSPAESALFREAMRDVRPLAAPVRPPAPRRRPRPARLAPQLPLQQVPAAGTAAEADAAAFARSGTPAAVLRKLRRGQYRVQAEIDLHGLTRQASEAQLSAFLARALQRELRCVRIIHGKGLRSGPGGPVLAPAVRGLLRQTVQVIAYVPERDAAGGSGALCVLLRP